MKKLTVLFVSVLLMFAFASCKDGNAEKPNNTDKDLSDPTLSITDCFELPYQYDLSPYIEIDRDDYFGIEIEKFDTTVTDDDVNNAIYEMLSENATLVDVADRGAQNGDTINIDFTGYTDGIAFDGGMAQGYEMVLGSGGMIDGFEDALVGHKAGEEFTIDVVFPENYKEELAGKPAQFEIKMNSIKQKSLPEFNEQFVKDNTDCETIDEYLAQLKEELIIKKASQEDEANMNYAYSALVENVTIKDYPENEYKYYYNQYVTDYEEIAKSYYNMSLENFITQVAGSTEEEFYYYAEMNAELFVEQELIVFSIANAENLWQGLKKADYDVYLKELAAEFEMDPAEFEAEYGSDEIWKSLIFDTTIHYVIDNATIVETTTETTVEE